VDIKEDRALEWDALLTIVGRGREAFPLRVHPGFQVEGVGAGTEFPKLWARSGSYKQGDIV
jgi:hypothetical protein